MKNGNEQYVNFHITKASIDPETGEKRWAATVSEFIVDEQHDEVTPQFYSHAIDLLKSNALPMPALVVSHFDDSRQEVMHSPTPDVFVAGDTREVYFDNDLPKAKGMFRDTVLGNVAFAAIKADIDNGVPREERIRISMGFRPEIGGMEKSNGVNRYVKGSIRHFALTRVPVIPSTNIEVKEKSDSIMTKKTDAISIVGDELATELDDAYTAIVKHKSDLTEKAGFDMGACIKEVVAEGKDQKQAVAICLSKAREGDAPPKDKSETEGDDMADELQEKLSEGFTNCMKVYRQKGFSPKTAREICNGLPQTVKKVKPTGVKKSETEDDDDGLQEKQGKRKKGNPNRSSDSGRFTSGSRGGREEDEDENGNGDSEETGNGGRTRGRKRRGRDKANMIEKQRGKREKVDRCINRHIAAGLSEEQAKETCENRLAKRLGIGKADYDGFESYYLVEKRDLSVPLGQCLSEYMGEEGMSREQAVEVCGSDKAKAARAKAGNEKAEYDEAELMEFMDLVISDEDVQVVKTAAVEEVVEKEVATVEAETEIVEADVDAVNSDETTPEVEELNVADVLEEVAQLLQADSVEIDVIYNMLEEVIGGETEIPESVTQEVAGESEEESPVTDVNTTVESDEMQELIQNLQVILNDKDLDRKAKSVMADHTLDALKSLAAQSIQDGTPASPEDTAALIKSVLEEALSPMQAQNDLLVARVNELEAEKSQSAPPQPKQLAPLPVQKSKVDDGQGAYSANEIASQTVNYSERPVY